LQLKSPMALTFITSVILVIGVGCSLQCFPTGVSYLNTQDWRFMVTRYSESGMVYF